MEADEGDEAEHSSLALYRESFPDQEASERLTHCPRKVGYVLVNRALGLTTPARCKANSCLYCGPVNAHLVAGALAAVRPQRMVRFSLVGNEWSTSRYRINKVTDLLRREGYQWNLAYHVEPNPAGTGRHAHGYQYGSFVPQALLQNVCERAGMGYPDIRKWEPPRQDPGKPVGYGLKLAGIDYGLKMADTEENLRTYLDCNGDRLVHATRGYWRDAEGKALAGVREAMTAFARSKGNDERIGTWELVRVDQVDRALRGSDSGGSRTDQCPA